jgi:hypothetical protein
MAKNIIGDAEVLTPNRPLLSAVRRRGRQRFLTQKGSARNKFSLEKVTRSDSRSSRNLSRRVPRDVWRLRMSGGL